MLSCSDSPLTPTIPMLCHVMSTCGHGCGGAYLTVFFALPAIPISDLHLYPCPYNINHAWFASCLSSKMTVFLVKMIGFFHQQLISISTGRHLHCKSTRKVGCHGWNSWLLGKPCFTGIYNGPIPPVFVYYFFIFIFFSQWGSFLPLRFFAVLSIRVEHIVGHLVDWKYCCMKMF